MGFSSDKGTLVWTGGGGASMGSSVVAMETEQTALRSTFLCSGVHPSMPILCYYEQQPMVVSDGCEHTRLLLYKYIRQQQSNKTCICCI